MQIADHNGQPRSAFINEQFAAPNAALLKALSERFTVRTFRFSSAPSRTTQQGELTFGGSQTRLGAALSGVRQELAGLPVAGLVMVSDGADTADAALGDALLGLKAEGLPVFTVGVGQETAVEGHPGRPHHHAEDRAQGHHADGRRRAVAVGLRRPAGHARRRRRRHAGQHAAGDAARRRHAGVDSGALHGHRGRSARAALPRLAAAGRAGHREQRARGADRRPRSQGEDPLLRGRAALRDEVHRPRHQGRQQPDPDRAAAHGRQQVHAHWRRHAGRAGGRVPQDPRGAVRVSRPDPRQHRGRRVHRRSDADDCRVRRSPRRRPADARRSARVCRRRLRRHRGRRRAAGGARSHARCRPRTPCRASR